jgi:hypothetical protein
MKASRELDALVAEKVMGCAPVKIGSGEYACVCNSEGHARLVRVNEMAWLKLIEPYSTDIAAAFEAAEACELFRYYALGKFTGPEGEVWGLEADNAMFAEADTAPLAICLAALKAKGVEV